MANTYDVGDVVRCTCTYTDANGAAQDPTVVKFSFLAPTALAPTVYTYPTDVALKKSATGVYYVDVNVTEAGRWHYRCYATGAGQSAGENWFAVQELLTV